MMLVIVSATPQRKTHGEGDLGSECALKEGVC